MLKFKQDLKSFTSEIGGITFPYLFSNSDTYLYTNNIKGISKLKFKIREKRTFKEARKKHERTIKIKKCYIGPFKGEFGNFLAHSLPFLQYLHQREVEIFFCGLEIHRPLLVDESGNSIVKEFIALRDFFAEVDPNSNATKAPKDVEHKIEEFKRRATQSNFPFWNLDDQFYYYFIHRPFVASLNLKLYNLSKVYKTENINACTLFPRSKGAKESHNNGKEWDYNVVATLLAKYFEKVYVVGHPTQSVDVIPTEKIEVRISNDNVNVLKACSNSSLIVSQHSGVIYLSNYFRNKFLMLYKGGEEIQDIGSLNNTLFFKNSLGNSSDIIYAFNEEQVEKKLKQLRNEKIRN